MLQSPLKREVRRLVLTYILVWILTHLKKTLLELKVINNLTGFFGAENRWLQFEQCFKHIPYGLSETTCI